MPRNVSARRALALLARIDRAASAFERAVLVAGVLLMAAVNIANVAARNLLASSLPFAEEASQILIVLVTFIGIGYGARYGRHIRMSALYDQARGRLRKALMVTITLGTSALLFVFAVYAASYVETQWTIGRVTPALRIPLYAVYAWVPVGFALGGVQYLLAALRNLASPGVWLSFEREERYEPAEEAAEARSAW